MVVIVLIMCVLVTATRQLTFATFIGMAPLEKGASGQFTRAAYVAVWFAVHVIAVSGPPGAVKRYQRVWPIGMLTMFSPLNTTKAVAHVRPSGGAAVVLVVVVVGPGVVVVEVVVGPGVVEVVVGGKVVEVVPVKG